MALCLCFSLLHSYLSSLYTSHITARCPRDSRLTLNCQNCMLPAQTNSMSALLLPQVSGMFWPGSAPCTPPSPHSSEQAHQQQPRHNQLDDLAV